MKIPSNLQSLIDPILELETADSTLAADIRGVRQKAQDASAYRAQLEASAKPDDTEALRCLADEAIRARLYDNKVLELEAQRMALAEETARRARALAREVRKMAGEIRTDGRSKFIDAIKELVVNEAPIVRSAVTLLRPKAELDGEQFEAIAIECEERIRHGRAPLEAAQRFIEDIKGFQDGSLFQAWAALKPVAVEPTSPSDKDAVSQAAETPAR